MKEAWSKKEIIVEGRRIFFSQDFSTKTQSERNKYIPIRKQLREKKVKTHVIFPAKLKVFVGEEVMIFNNLEDATYKLQELGMLPAGETSDQSAGAQRPAAAEQAFQRVG